MNDIWAVADKTSNGIAYLIPIRHTKSTIVTKRTTEGSNDPLSARCRTVVIQIRFDVFIVEDP